MYNFAAFGALGLFVWGGTFGVPARPFTAVGGKFLSNLLNYALVHPGDGDYLPIWYVVLSFGV